jgi:hypothetical protein
MTDLAAHFPEPDFWVASLGAHLEAAFETVPRPTCAHRRFDTSSLSRHQRTDTDSPRKADTSLWH